MQFTATALITILPALVAADCYRCGRENHQQPLDASNLADNENGNAGNAQGQNDCGVSSFNELTVAQDQQPLVDDCWQMINQIQGDYTWPVDDQGGTLTCYQTCAFNARSQGGPAWVGNADIIDLTTDSINKYGQNGNIGCQGLYAMFAGSSGGMPCDDPNWQDATQVHVDWTITRSDDSPECYANSQPWGQGQGQGQGGPGLGQSPQGRRFRTRKL